MAQTWAPHGPPNWFFLNFDACVQGSLLQVFLHKSTPGNWMWDVVDVGPQFCCFV